MIPETLLFDALTSLVDGRVYPDKAPQSAALPRIVYQQAGGKADVYVDGQLPDKENSRMQIACWATTRVAASAMAQQVEAAVVGVAALQATPIGARVSVYEEATQLYGSRQDFSLWCPR